MLIPGGGDNGGEGNGNGHDTTPPSGGSVVVSASAATALILGIYAGSDDSGAAPLRRVFLYDAQADRDAHGTGGLVSSYPRAISPSGVDVFGWAADGLAPTTHYWGFAEYSDAAGNVARADFDGVTSAVATGTLETSGASLLMWDSADPDHAYPWTLPPKPTITDVQRTDYTDSTFARPMNTLPAGAAYNTGGNLGTAWTVVGASLHSAEWVQGTLHGDCIHVDSDGVTGDGTERWYVKEAAEVDWSALNGLQFRGLSAGKEMAQGYFLAFSFAPDVAGSPGTWIDVPVEFKTPGTPEDVQVPFESVPAASRQHIRYWGWKCMVAEEFVVYMNNLRSYGALMGDFEYVFQLRKTLAAGTPASVILDGPESDLVTVNAGTNGSKCTLEFPAIPVGCTGLVWRLDVGTEAKFHLCNLTPLAEGVTTYEDTTVALGERSVLKAGRSPVPTGCSVMQMYHGRLALADPANKGLWLSSIDNAALWFPVTPAEWLDLKSSGMAATLFNEGDGMFLPFGKAWPIVAMAPLGSFTGVDYLGDMLVMTDSLDVRLTGVTQDTFSIGYQRAGGAANALAWCRMPGGSVARIEPHGQITLIDERFGRKGVSEAQLGEVLRLLGNKADWRIGIDTVFSKLLVTCASGDSDERAYVLDLLSGGWDQWDPGSYGMPSLLLERTEGEGTYLATACGPAIRRWLDPAGNPPSLGWLTATIYVDDVPVHALNPLSGRPYYIRKAHGFAVAIEIEAGAEGEAACLKWRSADWNVPGGEIQPTMLVVNWGGDAIYDFRLEAAAWRV